MKEREVLEVIYQWPVGVGIIHTEENMWEVHKIGEASYIPTRSLDSALECAVLAGWMTGIDVDGLRERREKRGAS